MVAAATMGLSVWLLRRFVCEPLELAAMGQLALLVTTGAVMYTALAWKEIRWLYGELGGR